MTISELPPPQTSVGELLPRQLAPGVHWLGDCFIWPVRPGHQQEHAYNATYLVQGGDRSLLVDTGHPNDWVQIQRQLDELEAAGMPPVEWIFVTHPEVTHAGNLGRLLARYPAARMCGDVRDHQLIFPAHTDRFTDVAVGDELDLGGRSFVIVEAVFRDLISSLWGYDRGEQVLFTADGLGFGHYHAAEHCGKVTEEVPDLPIQELTGEFMENALYWTRFKSVEPHIERLGALLEFEHPVRLIAPAHGSPVMEPGATVPKIMQGLQELAAKSRLR
jgi:flavorubredoxin